MKLGFRHHRHCTCAQCGAALSGPLLDIAMAWPDCVFALDRAERDARVWTSDDRRPDFVVLDEERFFVRGLLPVPLEDGSRFRYGVWLEVARDDFASIVRDWHNEQVYAGLRFRARLANAAPPWGERTLGAAVEAAPLIATERPSIITAADAWLADALRTGWDRATYEAIVRQYE